VCMKAAAVCSWGRGEGGGVGGEAGGLDKIVHYPKKCLYAGIITCKNG
jgi:hypothetical protein